MVKPLPFMVVAFAVLALSLSLTVRGDKNSDGLASRPESQIDKLGAETGKEIHNGFVFFEGRYLDGPYRVDRRGAGIYVNDVQVRRYDIRSCLFDPREYKVDEDPGIPATLTRESTFDDIDDREHILRGPRARKWRYLTQHFSLEEAEDKMIQWFRDLPFVKKVELRHPPSKSVINVTTFRGAKHAVRISNRSGRRTQGAPTPAGLRRSVQAERKRLEERLAKGDCFILLGRGLEISFDRRKAMRVLPPMVEALSSDKSELEKLRILQLWDVIPPDTKLYLSLVKNFKGSQQLWDRIREILKKHPRRPRPLSYVEQLEIQREVLKEAGTLEERQEMVRKAVRKKQARIIQEFERSRCNKDE